MSRRGSSHRLPLSDTQIESAPAAQTGAPHNSRRRAESTAVKWILCWIFFCFVLFLYSDQDLTQTEMYVYVTMLKITLQRCSKQPHNNKTICVMRQ